MFIDRIIRIARGAPDKIKPALKPAYRVGFEQLEARMVMSANFGFAAGDLALETLPYSEPPLGIATFANVSSMESSELYDFTSGLDLPQYPWEYESGNFFSSRARAQPASHNQRFYGEFPSEVVAGNNGFYTLEFDTLWEPWEYNSFSETTLTYQAFDGLGGDFLPESFGSISPTSSSNTTQVDSTTQVDTVIPFTKNVNNHYVIYVSPQSASFYAESGKIEIVHQVRSSDFKEFHFDKSERFSPADRPWSVIELGTSRPSQSVEVNNTPIPHSLGIDEDSVDIDSASQFDVEQQAEARRTSMHREVEDLLRGLHTPSSRFVEETEQPIAKQDSNVLPTTSDFNEGGMVLLRAAQHSNKNELFIVDEAYAQFGDLFDINVRMEPAIGAYQAFDVGLQTEPLASTRDHPVSSTDFNDMESGLEEKRIGNETANNASLLTRTGIGTLATLATGAIVARSKAVSRYWRPRYWQQRR